MKNTAQQINAALDQFLNGEIAHEQYMMEVDDANAMLAEYRAQRGQEEIADEFHVGMDEDEAHVGDYEDGH
jgi:hypothetical protein